MSRQSVAFQLMYAYLRFAELGYLNGPLIQIANITCNAFVLQADVRSQTIFCKRPIYHFINLAVKNGFNHGCFLLDI